MKAFCTFWTLIRVNLKVWQTKSIQPVFFLFSPPEYRLVFFFIFVSSFFFFISVYFKKNFCLSSEDFTENTRKSKGLKACKENKRRNERINRQRENTLIFLGNCENSVDFIDVPASMSCFVFFQMYISFLGIKSALLNFLKDFCNIG